MSDPERAPRARQPRLLVLLACFSSGAAALAFETLWFRQASLAFGNSVWASSLVLAGFMAGMACGYAIAVRCAARVSKPLWFFAALELLVAASGIALVYVLPQLPAALAQMSAALEAQPSLLQLARLGCAFLLMLVPATAMGMTLPVLVRALHVGRAEAAAAPSSFGRLLGLLYGFNTAGAVLGTLLPQLIWLPGFGVRGSSFAAAGCNLLAAALAWLAQSSMPAQSPAAAPPPSAASHTPLAWPWLLASALAGCAILGLEVVWLRLLMLFVNDTELAFAWVLAGVLVGISLGAWLAAIFGRDDPRSARYAGLIAFAAASAAALAYRAELQVIARYFSFDQSAGKLALPLTLPVAIASGWLFTVLGTGLLQATRDATAATSRNALANTLGGVVGSLLTGFWLLPNFGVERSLFALSVLLAIAGLLFVRDRAVPLALRIGPLVVCAAVLATFPWGALRPLFTLGSVGRWMRPGDELVSVREGTVATYSHVVHKLHGQPLFDQLATNAYSMSVNDFAARRYMKQYVYLPRAVHPKLERALVIGYGIGNTIAALLDDDVLKQLDVVDIASEGPELSRGMHTRPGPSPLDDKRLRLHLEDGRHYLAGHSETYDLITGEPPPPVIAGVVNLYSQEFFELARERLAPGGMVTYWLPLMNLSGPSTKAIIAGFCNAFADCSLWHGSARNFMLLGTNNPRGRKPVDAAHFAKQWQNPALAAELRDTGFELPQQLGAAFIGGADYLKQLTHDMPPLTDDRPKRVTIPGPTSDRDWLIWQWRNTPKARARFEQSALIASLWPSQTFTETTRQFENQRLLNDLLFPEPTQARQTRVLHQVLHGTPLQLPVLLLLNSDPDIQRVLADASPDELLRPEWQAHRLAGKLAQRDFPAALSLLSRIPQSALPYPDLTEYVEFVAARAQHATPFPNR